MARRTAVAALGLLVLGLLSACYTVVYPNQGPRPPVAPPARTAAEPKPAPTVFSQAQLCTAVTTAVHTMSGDILRAPDQASATRQYVESYTAYAVKLRELETKADSAAQRAKIEKAAAAADAYARAIDRSKTYLGVSDVAAKQTSRDAFPGCELGL